MRKLVCFAAVLMVFLFGVLSAEASSKDWLKAAAEGAITYALNKPTDRSLSNLGDELALQVKGESRTSSDPKLDRIAAEIAKAWQVPCPEILSVEQKDEGGGDSINAFAIPGADGGHIFVTKGLADLLEANSSSGDAEDCLAGVVGHELGHIVKNHAKHAWSNALKGQVLADVLINGAGASNSVSLGVTVLEFMREAKYSRDHEFEADDFGFESLVKTGRDPLALARTFKTMKQRLGEIPGYLQPISTHPKFDSRVSRIEKKAAATPMVMLPAPDQQDASMPAETIPPVRLILRPVQMDSSPPEKDMARLEALVNKELIGTPISIVIRGGAYERALDEQHLKGVDPRTRVESGRFYGATGEAEILVTLSTGRSQKSSSYERSDQGYAKSQVWFHAEVQGIIRSISYRTLAVPDVSEAEYIEVLVQNSSSEVKMRDRNGETVRVQTEERGDFEAVATERAWRGLARKLGTSLRAAFARLPRQDGSEMMAAMTTSSSCQSDQKIGNRITSYGICRGGNIVQQAKIGQQLIVYSRADTVVDSSGRLVKEGKVIGEMIVTGYCTSANIAQHHGVPWSQETAGWPIGQWVSWAGSDGDKRAGLLLVPR